MAELPLSAWGSCEVWVGRDDPEGFGIYTVEPAWDFEAWIVEDYRNCLMHTEDDFNIPSVFNIDLAPGGLARVRLGAEILEVREPEETS